MSMPRPTSFLLGIVFSTVIIYQVIVTSAFSGDKQFYSIKNNFIKGYKYTLNGQSEKAFKSFSEIQDVKTPVQDYVLFYLGKLSLELQRCEEARAFFQKLLNEYPESRWALVA